LGHNRYARGSAARRWAMILGWLHCCLPHPCTFRRLGGSATVRVSLTTAGRFSDAMPHMAAEDGGCGGRALVQGGCRGCSSPPSQVHTHTLLWVHWVPIAVDLTTGHTYATADTLDGAEAPAGTARGDFLAPHLRLRPQSSAAWEPAHISYAHIPIDPILHDSALRGRFK
jgi:hypothetical protein